MVGGVDAVAADAVAVDADVVTTATAAAAALTLPDDDCLSLTLSSNSLFLARETVIMLALHCQCTTLSSDPSSMRALHVSLSLSPSWGATGECEGRVRREWVREKGEKQ